MLLMKQEVWPEMMAENTNGFGPSAAIADSSAEIPSHRWAAWWQPTALLVGQPGTMPKDCLYETTT